MYRVLLLIFLIVFYQKIEFEVFSFLLTSPIFYVLLDHFTINNTHLSVHHKNFPYTTGSSKISGFNLLFERKNCLPHIFGGG